MTMAATRQPHARSLEAQIIVVTGASTGIGRATALELSSRGADVVLHGRTVSNALREVAGQITSAGGKATMLAADFSDRGALLPMVDEAFSWQGRVDAWINNAGGDVLTGDLKEATIGQKLDYLFAADVAATLLISREVGKRMIAVDPQKRTPSEHSPYSGRYSILNTGWDQAWQGMEGDAGELFATTKGSVMAMTKSLAQSLAPCVRVNAIAPGWIRTDWGEQTSEYWDRRAKSESLMNRWGTPQDVAGVAAFLCSPAASFISGQIVSVNGGFRHRQDSS